VKSSNAVPSVRRVITLTRASKVYDIPHSTLRQWIREGRLKAYRIAGGRQVRIYIEDLEALFIRIGGDD
jgi:excisionase family DNA binding protein